MRLICPACGATCSAEAWENDERARLVFAEILALPPVVGQVALRYLGLFRPRGAKTALAWARAMRIVQALRREVSAGHVQWEGKPARPAPAAIWAAAIQQMLDAPPQRLPLKSHGYLKSIAYDLADQADKAAEKHRRAIENSGAFRRPAGATSGDPEPLMTVEQMKQIRMERFKLRGPA